MTDQDAIAAAKAQGEAATAAWAGAAAADPGVGALLPLPGTAISAGELRGLPDEPALPPVVGEGYAIPAPAQPAQVTANMGQIAAAGRPGYAAGVVGDEDPFLGGQ